MYQGSYYRMIPDVGDLEEFSIKSSYKFNGFDLNGISQYETYTEMHDYVSEFIENIKF